MFGFIIYLGNDKFITFSGFINMMVGDYVAPLFTFNFIKSYI